MTLLQRIIAFLISIFTAITPAPAAPLSPASPVFEQSRTVLAHDFDEFEIWLAAGEHALLFEGNGKTNVDFYVFDEEGNLVAFDEASHDVALLWVEPDATSIYYVFLVNRGEVDNEVAVLLDRWRSQ